MEVWKILLIFVRVICYKPTKEVFVKKERNYTITYINGGVIHYLKREQGCIIFTTNIKEAIKFIDREGAKTFIDKCLYGFRNHGFNIFPLFNPLSKSDTPKRDPQTTNNDKYVIFDIRYQEFVRGMSIIGKTISDYNTSLDLTKAMQFDSTNDIIKFFQGTEWSEYRKKFFIIFTFKEAESMTKQLHKAKDKDYGYILLHKSGKVYYFSEHIFDKDKSAITEKIDDALWFEKLEDIQKFKKTLVKGVWHIAPLNKLMRFGWEEKSTYYLHKQSKVDSQIQSAFYFYHSLSELKLDLAKNWKSDKEWFVSKYKAIVNLNMTSRSVPSNGIPKESTPMTLDEKINGLKEWVTHIAKTHNNAVDSSEKEIKNIKIRLDNIEHKVDAFLKDLKTSLERGL